jgi:hypothetical protein
MPRVRRTRTPPIKELLERHAVLSSKISLIGAGGPAAGPRPQAVR